MSIAKKHVVRIIAGQYRKSTLAVIDVPGLRPTGDRIRETLFNWINHQWAGEYSDKQVLDLFAGTGALGFEAASRGASHVQMVEKNPIAAKALRACRDKLNATQVHINDSDALLVLERLNNNRFDLVFLDPPFALDILPKVMGKISPVLAPDALVYIESGQAYEPNDDFTVIKSEKAGAVYYQLLSYKA